MSDAEQAMARTAGQLAAVIVRVAEQAKTTRSTGFSVPVLEADPPAESPTNVWLLADGRLRTRTPDGLVHEYQPYVTPMPAVPTFSANPAFSTGWRLWFDGATGELRGYLANGNVVRYVPATGSTSAAGGTPPTPAAGSTVSKPADPKPRVYRKTYTADWARIFCAQHGVETGSNLNYGYYSGTHGERRIMFGFPDGTMRSDLSGAKITKVELRMRNTYSWAYSGITIHFGLHRKDAAPGSFSQSRKDVYVGGWPRSGYGGGSDTWRTVSKTIGERFRDDTARGMTIDQPSGVTSYGECDWNSLQLRISYTK